MYSRSCCLCFHLREGMYFLVGFSAFTHALSLAANLASQAMPDTLGYHHSTLLIFTHGTAVLFSVIGLVGVHESKVRLILWFAIYYTIASIIVLTFALRRYLQIPGRRSG